MRDGVGLDHGRSSGGARKWSESEFIFEVEPTGFPDASDVRCERKRKSGGTPGFLMEQMEVWSCH